MKAVLHKIKELSTIYIYIIIFGTALFSLFIDCTSLRKKKLKKEEKICKGIGYAYITFGVVLFVIMKIIL